MFVLLELQADTATNILREDRVGKKDIYSYQIRVVVVMNIYHITMKKLKCVTKLVSNKKFVNFSNLTSLLLRLFLTLKVSTRLDSTKRPNPTIRDTASAILRDTNPILHDLNEPTLTVSSDYEERES